MARRAVIDVGTNSVKVLVAEVADGIVEPVWEEGEQTRLGAGFYAHGRLQADRVAATAEAVARLARRAGELGAARPRVFATSAARDAANPGLLLDAVREASGLQVEVISGEQEAAWVFRGATSLAGLTTERLLVVDVGGGSTELAWGTLGAMEGQTSLPLGALRLLETYPPGDPPSPAALERTREAVVATLDQERRRLPAEAVGATGVGVGGAMLILARMLHRRGDFDRAWLDSAVLTPEDLAQLSRTAWSLPLAERKGLPGLPPERADVILGGAVLYEAVARVFHLPRIRVSTRGLRVGALLA